MTLILFDHKMVDNKAVSIFYEYKLQASQEYLHKFDQPYSAFESDLTIHRRVIPVKKNTLRVLCDAIHRATAGIGDQAEMSEHVDREADIPSSLFPVDPTKRKTMDEPDSNTITKRVKGSDHKEEESVDVV